MPVATVCTPVCKALHRPPDLVSWQSSETERAIRRQDQEPTVKMSLRVVLVAGSVFIALASARAADNTPPKGFVALFNGKDLTGWKGLLKEPFDNPARRAKLTPEEAAEAQKEADQVMRKGWRVEKGDVDLQRPRPQHLHRQGLRRFRDVRRLEDRVPTAIAASISAARRRCKSGIPSPSRPRTAAKSVPAGSTTT